MRRILLAIAILLLAGAGWYFRPGSDRPLPPSPPASTRPNPPSAEAKLLRTRFRDLDIAVPEAWSKDVSRIGDTGLLFRGPKEEGFMPNVMFYWWRGGRDPARFIEEKRMALKGGLRPAERVLESSATVAGMTAARFLYTFNEPTGVYRVVDYVFAGASGAGMVRGTSLVGSAERHVALFDALAAQVRFDPEPSK